MSARLDDLSRLSCSTICFRQFSLAESLAAIASLGFTHVDIGALPDFCPHFNLVAGNAADERAFIRVVHASGLQVHTFTSHLGHFNFPTVDQAAALEAGRRTLRVAAELGALGVNVNCGGYRDRLLYPFAADVEAVAQVIRPLADEAAAVGLRLMIEAPHKGNLIRTPDEALLLLSACGRPDVQLVYDVNHHHAAGWTPAHSVAQLGAARIGIVHLRDAIGRENRYPLGVGEIDFTAVFNALHEIGFAGRCSFEFTDAAPTLAGNVEQLRRSLDFLASLPVPPAHPARPASPTE
jgi:sugar phosphate isomerase/epimerase